MLVKPNTKILWLTNLPAPYRYPIWDHITRQFDLKVTFLLKEKNWRNWPVPKNATWKFQFLSLNSKKIKEIDLVPSFRGSKSILKGIEVLIAGGWEAPFYWRTIRIAKRLDIPVIQFYESTQISHRFNNFLVRKIRSAIFSKADFIVTAGSASTRAVEAMGIAPQKIITLFNPVDVSWFHSFVQSHRVQHVPGHRFIFVGQLIDRKNVATVIRAFAEIHTESDTLTIAGDGPLAQGLQELTQTLGISNSVFFVGHQNQEELAKLYAASHTLILASTNEVWGLVVNEALASGLHVIVSDKCGVLEFVEDMDGVYICSTEQKSIQAALLKSLQEWSGYIENPEILKFTPEKFADGVIEVIRNVLRGSLQPDLVWLTNIPTPYRIPTWKILDSRLKFKLLILAKSERNRNWNLEILLDGLDCKILNLHPFYSKKVLPLYFNFLKPIMVIRRINGKVIYIDGWESPAFFISAQYAKKRRMKLIYGYRSTQISHRFNNFLVRKIRSAIFSKADFIVTAGSASTRAVEAMGIAPQKIITLFNPVDVSWFHSFVQSHRVQHVPGHRFIFVGQLIDRKNVATVIRAFAEIHTESDTLTIAGDGPLAQGLQELTQTLGISNSVFFVGHQNQEELAKLYAASHTLILASTNEVWGLVVNEALASGLHVIVSDKCGVLEFVEDMDGVYICSTEQKSIQAALLKSLQEWSGYIENPEILKFTPEKFADGVIEVALY